jgi:hypothetical protein
VFATTGPVRIRLRWVTDGGISGWGKALEVAVAGAPEGQVKRPGHGEAPWHPFEFK